MIEDNNKNDEIVISIADIWAGIRKRLVPIILITIVIAIATGLVNYYLITPKYEATATVIVGKNKDKDSDTLQYNDVLLSQRLVDTYTVIMGSQTIYNQIVDELDLNLTPKELQSMIKISTVKDTEVIRVTVKDTIPERAMDIANECLEIFEQEIKNIMQLDNVHILDSAQMPTSPVEPKIIKNSMQAGLITLALGIVIAILLQLADTTIKNEEDIKSITNIPIIGQIPYIKEQ